MSEHGVLKTFDSHPFLSAMPDRLRMLLATGVRPFTAEPNELFAKEGDSARSFYLIQSGHVGLELHAPKRGVVRIQTVQPGEIVGWSWIVPPHRWRFDCRAVDKVSGLAFDAEWLRHQCEQNHELGYCVLKQLLVELSHRLASTRVQLMDVYK
jgi:CRP-like cAMP-binding protein